MLCIISEKGFSAETGWLRVTATVSVLSSLLSSSHQLLSSWSIHISYLLIYERSLIVCTICYCCTLWPQFRAIGIGAVVEPNLQVDGCGCQLLISILLTLVSFSTSWLKKFHFPFSQLGFLPGIIHAFWVTMKADSKAAPRSNTTAWSGLELAIKKRVWPRISYCRSFCCGELLVKCKYVLVLNSGGTFVVFFRDQ